jgi:hypothetical protein
VPILDFASIPIAFHLKEEEDLQGAEWNKGRMAKAVGG